MPRFKAASLLICGIAIFLFGATFFAFRDPPETKTHLSRRKQYTVEDAPILPSANQRPPRRLLEVPTYMRMVNASKNAISIDISHEDVNFHDLDRQTVIVTGLSQYTEKDGVGLVASAQIHMPFKKIIIYDLGVKKRTITKLAPLCNVEIRKFQYTNYPAHVKILRNNAWKLIIITEVLEEFGAVFYANPRLRFRAPINILFPFIKKMHGFIPSMSDHSSLIQVTHPAMLQLMKVSASTLTISGGHVISGHMLLLVMNTTFFDSAVPRLQECFLRSKCLHPPGSHWQLKKPTKRQHLHHFDLSALSLIMYQLYGDAWVPTGDVRQAMQKLYVVSKHSDPVHELSWSFRCNPPKEEFDPTRILQKKL